MRFLFYFVFIIALVASKNEDYKGYRIYKIRLTSEQQQEKLSLNRDVIDYLTTPNIEHGVDGLAILRPSHFKWFEEELTKIGIPVDVFSKDLHQYLAEAEKTESSERTADDVINIRQYHKYDVILDYLRRLSEQYSTGTSRVQLVQHGVTHEDRPLVYLKINNINNGGNKPVIVVEAAIIPREWITIPSVLHVVERILEETRFLVGADWIVLPVVNPDGYEYTHTNLRLWKKSRSIKSNLGPICPGVNINRNFDIDWLRFNASSSPCSHLYAGIEPNSEVETNMIQSIITDYGSRIKLYISLQNRGGFISYPWGYERAASGMFVQHHLLGVDMARAMHENYKLGVASTVFDRASGTSSDYARDKNVVYTYNLDIVHRSNTVIIPEADISAIVDDVWRAVAVAANEIIRLYN